MREIKFRAWVTEYADNKDGSDGYMLALGRHDNQFDFEDGFVMAFAAYGGFWGHECYDDREVKWKVMQFTGLKDSDGREIWEGDILGGYPHGTAFVKWGEEYACWESVSIDDNTDACILANDLKECSPEWKVIGNIHENPDLI